jgi:mannose-6-phosphate isomerase-like protein (cupin superfamily)
MASAGQVIEGHGGFRLRLMRTGAETGGEVLEMEAAYGGDAPMPPEHLHPRQVEIFEVLEGAMQTIIGGQERRYEAGERFEVPIGTPHQMAAVGATRVRWEVRPAMRTADFFERLHSGTAVGPAGAATLAEFLDEFDEEIRFTGA